MKNKSFLTNATIFKSKSHYNDDDDDDNDISAKILKVELVIIETDYNLSIRKKSK